MFQYRYLKFDRQMRTGFSICLLCRSTSRLMSYDIGPLVRRYGSGGGSCVGLSVRKGSRASIVTTHGEIDVPKFLPRNGPSGTYSHAWMSRALQSLTSTMPKR